MCILGWVSTEFHMKQAGDLYVWRRGGGTGAKPADNKQCNFSSLNEGGTRKGRRRPYLSKRLTDANTRRGVWCRRSSSGLDPSEGTPHSRTHSLRERVPCLHRLHPLPTDSPALPLPSVHGALDASAASARCLRVSFCRTVNSLPLFSLFIPPRKKRTRHVGIFDKNEPKGEGESEKPRPPPSPSFLPSPLFRLQLLASNN